MLGGEFVPMSKFFKSLSFSLEGLETDNVPSHIIKSEIWELCSQSATDTQGAVDLYEKIICTINFTETEREFVIRIAAQTNNKIKTIKALRDWREKNGGDTGLRNLKMFVEAVIPEWDPESVYYRYN
jgi:hypothetical protein